MLLSCSLINVSAVRNLVRTLSVLEEEECSDKKYNTNYQRDDRA